MVSTRWLAAFERCCILIRFSIAPMTRSNASSCAASPMTLARASIGSLLSRSSATITRNSLTPALPCAATMPNSARCARKAMIWVRWRISTSRVWRHRDAEQVGGLPIDDELNPDRLLDRQIGRLCAFARILRSKGETNTLQGLNLEPFCLRAFCHRRRACHQNMAGQPYWTIWGFAGTSS
jgi:hypothetical protein